MNDLQKHIEEFYSSDKKLTERMKELAKVFLFGGYIKIREEYCIYLRTVEFYYHEEDGEEKDPIMYHRNNYHVDGEIPYFKPLSFNSHDTGVDITFENEEKHIRASVLIRAYEVWDCTQKCWLLWNPAEQQFQTFDKVHEQYKDKTPKYNTQSMYVKKLLNGFTSSGQADITWENVDFDEKQKISNIRRQGVYEYEKEPYAFGRWNKVTPLRREDKKWAFRREIDVELK